MTVRKLALAINAWLPEDIRVLSAAGAGKNSRAVRRRASNTAISSGTIRDESAAAPPRLAGSAQAGSEGHARRRTAVCRHGTISNRSPASRNYEMESTVRTLTRCDIKKSGRN
jgi:hypothetical protein